MATKVTQPVEPIHCDGCGKPIGTGGKIFLLHIWIVGKDYCESCKDVVIKLLDELPRSLQPAHYETSN